MADLKLNGEQIAYTKTTLAEFLEARGYEIDGSFAVAINQIFIPRQKYAVTVLQENDDLEVVSAMQGG